MINTVKYLNKLPIDGIKIHMLHVINNSPLGKLYKENPFSLLTLEEYVDIVVEQLRLLPPNIVIHRITGDADKNELIAPEWTLKKFVVMNEIDKLMRKENYYQGDLYVQNSRI
jgi:radical SAM superfamily enzyme